MDINEYMEKSLANQVEQVKLLTAVLAGIAAIAAASGGEVSQTHDEVTIRVPKGNVQKVAEQVATEMAADKPKADAAKGSTKQASNHARDDAQQEAEKPKKLSADDVRAALMKLGKVQGSEAAVALLQEHGSTSVSGLPAEKYQDVIDAANAAAQEAGA